MTTPQAVEEAAKTLSDKVRYFAGKGQYEEGSSQQKAYLDGVNTAIGMMYIDLTGTPKSVGMLTTLHQRAYQSGFEDGKKPSTVKTCTFCKKEKDLSAFYKYGPKRKYAYQSRCRECNTAASVESGRRTGRYRTQRYRDLRKQYFKNYFERHPERIRAKYAVKYALRKGILKRMPCQECGNAKSQAHHPDYSQPLKVLWLCQKHHSEAHKGDRKIKNV